MLALIIQQEKGEGIRGGGARGVSGMEGMKEDGKSSTEYTVSRVEVFRPKEETVSWKNVQKRGRSDRKRDEGE